MCFHQQIYRPFPTITILNTCPPKADPKILDILIQTKMQLSESGFASGEHVHLWRTRLKDYRINKMVCRKLHSSWAPVRHRRIQKIQNHGLGAFILNILKSWVSWFRQNANAEYALKSTAMFATDCGLDSSGNPFCGIGNIETGPQCAAKRLEHNWA